MNFCHGKTYTYPLPSPIRNIEEDVPPSLLLGRQTTRRWQIRILHHPLLKLDVPPPVAVVELLCGDFLQDVSRKLIEDGKEGFGGETRHLGVQRRDIRYCVGGWEGEIWWYYGLDVGLDEWGTEGGMQGRVPMNCQQGVHG